MLDRAGLEQAACECSRSQAAPLRIWEAWGQCAIGTASKIWTDLNSVVPVSGTMDLPLAGRASDLHGVPTDRFHQNPRALTMAKSPSRSDHRANQLLAALEPEDFAALAPNLETVRLPKGMIVYETGDCMPPRLLPAGCGGLAPHHSG